MRRHAHPDRAAGRTGDPPPCGCQSGTRSDNGTKPPPSCPVNRALRVAGSTASPERRTALPADLIRRGFSCQVESGTPERDAADRVIGPHDTVGACRAAPCIVVLRWCVGDGSARGRFQTHGVVHGSRGDEAHRTPKTQPGDARAGWRPACGACRGRGMPPADVTIWRIRGSAENSAWRPRRPRHEGQRQSAGGLGMGSPECPPPARPVRLRYSL
jgi:hypothetical protein